MLGLREVFILGLQKVFAQLKTNTFDQRQSKVFIN
jgi:hypothetical protein